MAAVSKVEITETREERKQILAHQKPVSGKERVQLSIARQAGAGL